MASDRELTESTKKKVLLVEDNRDSSDMIKEDLEGKVFVLQAFTIEEAEEIFQRHPDLAVVVMDACVPGHTINTIPLVYKMRETFMGPMIAISSEEEYREELMQAGCDHKSDKNTIAKKVLKLVGVS